MPLFRETNAQKYTPKQIKFFELYKHSTGSDAPSGSVQQAAREALAKAGFDDGTINKIVFENQPIPVSVMQKVAHQLNQNQVYGFSRDPKAHVKNYLQKQMVRNMSIARVRKEHMIEERADFFDALKNRGNLGRFGSDAKPGPNQPRALPKSSPRSRLPF